MSKLFKFPSRIPEVLKQLWDSLMNRSRRRKLSERRFDLLAPPSELKQVWHICDLVDSNEPVSVNLAGLAQVWLKGWFAPEQDLSSSDCGLKLYFNGEFVGFLDEDHLPGNAPEIGGCFAIFSDDMRFTSQTASLMTDKIRRLIEARLDRWLTEEMPNNPETYRVIQRILPVSNRLRNLLLTHLSYQTLARKYHLFEYAHPDAQVVFRI